MPPSAGGRAGALLLGRVESCYWIGLSVVHRWPQPACGDGTEGLDASDAAFERYATEIGSRDTGARFGAWISRRMNRGHTARARDALHTLLQA